MPRSKRHKVVSLTKTKAKSMEDKTDTIEMLRSAVDEYKNVFAFTYENMRSAAFKEVRMHFKESRLFLGKNKVAQVALGKGKEEEYRENLHKVGAHLSGDSGLFFEADGNTIVGSNGSPAPISWCHTSEVLCSAVNAANPAFTRPRSLSSDG